MARQTGAQCKICRRIGEKLFLKGNRCSSDKCAIERRPYPPGRAGKGRRSKLSNYGVQLREKQKSKKMFGMLEKQFRLYFKLADRKKGVTGTNLLRLLEYRLDSIVYRLGFALSRNNARQLVRHRFFTVNGKTVDIPSFQVKPEDVIAVRDKESKVKQIKENMELTQSRSIPEWLECHGEKLTASVKRIPEREDMEQIINEQFIVELYSK